MDEIKDDYLNKYFIINKKYLGKCLYKKLSGYICYVENNINLPVDKIVEHYGLGNVETDVFVKSTSFKTVTKENLSILIKNESKKNNFEKIKNKIMTNYNTFCNSFNSQHGGKAKINASPNQLYVGKAKINASPNQLYVGSKINVSPNQLFGGANPYIGKVGEQLLYEREDMGEDNYEEYMSTYMSSYIMDNLLSEENILHEEIFDDGRVYAGKAEDLNLIEEGQKDNVIKPSLKTKLELFEKIDTKGYFNLTNTISYKHIINDDKMDLLPLGMNLIKEIKKNLLELQSKYKFEDGTAMTDIINLFSYLKFKIIGGYIVIEGTSVEGGTVTDGEEKLNLILLKDQYGKPIDYPSISSIILKNKNVTDVTENNPIIVEALKILAQEYFICFQPKIEYLLWTLNRLILCWYCDKTLSKNIFKIKVLINTYRSRGQKKFNKEVGVLPLIVIVGSYGRKATLETLSHLSHYWFPYNNVGNPVSRPSFFNKISDLIYYTNGSLDLKQYINLLKINNVNVEHLDNIFSSDMSKINLNNETNDIEYELPYETKS